ncbi:MAG: hypothetical protein ABIO70_08945 [Pseudomonadota bacterium]
MAVETGRWRRNSLGVYTWDFDLEVHNAALRDETLARRGLDLFERLVARFPGESRHRRILQHQRAEFLYLVGDRERGEAQLLALIDEDPDDASGYAWLSEHLGSRRSPAGYRDLPRAIALLEGALARPVRDPEDYSYRLRLEQLRADLAKSETVA